MVNTNVLFKIIGVQLKKVYMQKFVFTGTSSPTSARGCEGGGGRGGAKCERNNNGMSPSYI